MEEPEDTSPSGRAVWLAVVRTDQAVDRFGRLSLGPLRLRLTDFVVLESLVFVGPLMPSQLSEKAGVTRGSITSAVNRLGAQGLVRREANSGDGRSSVVHVTEAGAEAFRAALKQHSEDVDQVMNSALSSEEMVVLLKLLGRVRRAAKRESRRRAAR